MPSDVSNCPWCVNDILNMKGKGYGLAGVTCGSGSHFVSNMRCIPSNNLSFMIGCETIIHRVLV